MIRRANSASPSLSRYGHGLVINRRIGDERGPLDPEVVWLYETLLNPKNSGRLPKKPGSLIGRGANWSVFSHGDDQVLRLPRGPDALNNLIGRIIAQKHGYHFTFTGTDFLVVMPPVYDCMTRALGRDEVHFLGLVERRINAAEAKLPPNYKDQVREFLGRAADLGIGVEAKADSLVFGSRTIYNGASVPTIGVVDYGWMTGPNARRNIEDLLDQI